MVSPPTSTVTQPARRAAVSLLLPREHGAYGQLLFPVATALVVGDGAPAAFAVAIACAAAFVGHEALLTLLGHRGARASRDQRQAATWWITACAAVAAAAVASSLGWMTLAARLSLLLPGAVALLLAPFIWLRREHSTPGEIIAAVGLSSCGVPVALAGGVVVTRALASWAVFALSFVVATVAVRSVIARVRSARLAPQTSHSNRSAAWLAAVVIAFASVAAQRGWMPLAAPLALLPVCALAGGLALRPPHPRHLRTIGWSLVTATAVTAVVLAVAR